MPLALRPPDPALTLAEAEAALRAAPEAARRAIYEAHCFPLAAAAAWAGRDDAPAAALLIVPVGTQPYSPLLALLSTRADRVALLVTEPQDDGARSPGSRPTAAEVCAAVEAGWPTPGAAPALTLFSIGDGLDGARVADAVGAALLWAGDPWPREVSVDVSGGRKATTAALGALGGGLGFRLSYIEGRHVTAGYYVDERRHALADAAGLLGVDQRAIGAALFEAGSFEAAARCLDEVCALTLAGPAAPLLAAAARALTGGGRAPLSSLAEAFGPLGDAGTATGAALRAADLAPTDRAQALLDGLRLDGAWR